MYSRKALHFLVDTTWKTKKLLAQKQFKFVDTKLIFFFVKSQTFFFTLKSCCPVLIAGDFFQVAITNVAISRNTETPTEFALAP